MSINVLAEIPAKVVDNPEFNELDKLENQLSKIVENIEKRIII